MTNISFTRREEELMGFLWSYGQPLTASQILERCEEHIWSDPYLRVMLRSLEKKGVLGYLEPDINDLSPARRFYPTITKEEYYIRLAENRGADPDALLRSAAVAMVRDIGENGKEEFLRKLDERIDSLKKE